MTNHNIRTPLSNSIIFYHPADIVLYSSQLSPFSLALIVGKTAKKEGNEL
jgi:hypothetical protein